jgi:hypothetical protein
MVKLGHRDRAAATRVPCADELTRLGVTRDRVDAAEEARGALTASTTLRPPLVIPTIV